MSSWSISEKGHQIQLAPRWNIYQVAIRYSKYLAGILYLLGDNQIQQVPSCYVSQAVTPDTANTRPDIFQPATRYSEYPAGHLPGGNQI